MNLHTDRKGSLTVEAAIILPLFLCFFFLLAFLIKVACIHISLDHAAGEAAKEVAAMAYPLSFVNEKTDELKKESDELTATLPEQLLGGLLTGNIDEIELQRILNVLGGREFTEEIGFSWKDQLQEQIVRSLLEDKLAGTYINSDEVCLGLVQFPQSDWEHKKNGNDYDKDDAVIVLEYPMTVPLPFFADWRITLRHTAVEKAWLSGGNGIYSSRQEVGIYEQQAKEEIVYVTRTGVKYHKEGCRYLQKSKIPLVLQEAQSSYRACKICRP